MKIRSAGYHRRTRYTRLPIARRGAKVWSECRPHSVEREFYPYLHERMKMSSGEACCRSSVREMDGGLPGEMLVFAPSAALLTALTAMVPLWLALYLRCRSEARRIRPERALGRLEEIEHD